jgi:hypothetical protein
MLKNTDSLVQYVSAKLSLYKENIGGQFSGTESYRAGDNEWTQGQDITKGWKNHYRCFCCFPYWYYQGRQIK